MSLIKLVLLHLLLHTKAVVVRHIVQVLHHCLERHEGEVPANAVLPYVLEGVLQLRRRLLVDTLPNLFDDNALGGYQLAASQ